MLFILDQELRREVGTATGGAVVDAGQVENTCVQCRHGEHITLIASGKVIYYLLPIIICNYYLNQPYYLLILSLSKPGLPNMEAVINRM